MPRRHVYDLISAAAQADEDRLIAALTSTDLHQLKHLVWVMSHRLPGERGRFPQLLDRVAHDATLRAIRQAAGSEPTDDPVDLLALPATLQPDLVVPALDRLWGQDRDGYVKLLLLVLTEQLEADPAWTSACRQLFQGWVQRHREVDRRYSLEITTAFYCGVSCDAEVVEAARQGLHPLARNQVTSSVDYIEQLTRRIADETDPDVLDGYTERSNWQARAAVAANPAAAPTTIQRLAKDRNTRVIRVVARRTDLGHATLTTMMTAARAGEAGAIVRNPSLDAAAEVDLLHDKVREFETRSGAASFAAGILSRDGLPLDLVDEALGASLHSRRAGSRGAAADVRTFVLYPAVTVDAVWDLLPMLDNTSVAQAAVEAVDQRFGREVATTLLERLVMDGTDDARQFAITHPACPEEYQAFGALL